MVERARAEYGMTERHACRLLEQWRGTQRYEPIQRNDEDVLTRAIVTLATQYGRYGYRRITALLRAAGWQVGKDRVQRIWRREGLKVPAKQRSRGRLWLEDGSCVRLRPASILTRMSRSMEVSVLLFSDFKGGGYASLGSFLNAEGLGVERQHSLKLEERIVALYDELRQPLYRYLICLGLGPDEVEEVIQESFLRLYKHLHGGGGDENLRSWLYRVAHNLTVNRNRNRGRTEEATPERWQELALSTSDPAPGPEEILLHKEKMIR